MDQFNKDKERVKKKVSAGTTRKKHHTEKPRLWIAGIEEEEGEFSFQRYRKHPLPRRTVGENLPEHKKKNASQMHEAIKTPNR